MTPEATAIGAAGRGWGPARQTLRALLSRHASFGLCPAALDALIARVEFACFRPGQEVASSAQSIDAMHIVVGGVVRIVCDPEAGVPVTAQLIGPGGFVHLVPGSATLRRVRAVAHTPALVGVLPHEAWRDVASHLRLEEALRLAACSCHTLSRRLYDKCVLLPQPIRVRVLHELRVLARDFGRPHPAGVCIDVPLSHADLAALVGAARANVTRAVGSLRAAGVLAATPGRLVLAAGA